MTELLRALKAFFQESLAEWRSQSSDGETMASVNVFIGAPPHRSETDPEQYPLIVIRPKEGEDSRDIQNRAEAAVEIICGVHVLAEVGTPEQGTVDICQFVDRVRLELLKTKRLEGRFSLQLPLEWQVGGEDGDQPHPQYLATITSRWQMPGIDRILTPEKEAEIHGSGFKGLSQAQE